MTLNRRKLLTYTLLGSVAVPAVRHEAQAATHKPLSPTLFLIGDSTVKNGTAGQMGWGTVLPNHLPTTVATVENRARGGRSSRTYRTEGLWDEVLKQVKAGDWVLMQFGHNDGGEKFKGNRPRGSIRGNGEETETGVVEMTGKEETVHSYGWYLRQFAAEAKAKGAKVIICSPVPRNIFREGKVARSANDYGKWAKEAAEQSGATFLDLNALVADRYDTLGPEKVAPLFHGDHTHTSPAGADLTASLVAEQLKRLLAGSQDKPG